MQEEKANSLAQACTHALAIRGPTHSTLTLGFAIGDGEDKAII